MAQETQAPAQRTARATAHHRIGRIFPAFTGKAAAAALLTATLWAALLSAPKPVFSEDGLVLPQSGIHYPGGFDLNTVGVVEGKVYSKVTSGNGPVQFQIQSGDEPYTILVSPQWFWEELGASLPEGTDVRVRGSKSLGKDGRLYMVAQEILILPESRSLVIRAEDGRPLWSGPRRGTTGTHGRFGSSHGGAGGGRTGGMRHGR